MKQYNWVKTAFWRTWVKSDEIQRQKLIKQLKGLEGSNTILINGYFEDLLNYLKKEKEE